ncbi:MAG: hypothetical protein JNK15_20355, partial [Planctomycetes bacterium]|nr:hypothetical protein [Planctomycetota bacterium]
MGIRAASVVAFVLSFAVPAAAQSGAPTELVQAMAVQPEPADGIVVQVVGEKGKPAKAPLVCVLPAVWTDEQKAKVEELHKTHALRPNEAAAAVAHAFGTAFRADATGTVRVPADARRVMACDGGFVGEVVLGKVPDGPVSVRLLGPRAVFARVRTAEGKVVGDVPLMVGSGRFGLGETYRSDARGESVLRLRLGERMQEDMWVEAVLPGARQRMDLPSPWPRSAIDLVVAPSGMLRVIAYDAKEQPRTDVRRVRLLWDGDFLGVEGKAEPSGAMFRVATHMRYEVEVTFAGTGGTQKVSCAGPERAGEMVVCEVRGVTGPPVLAVRVLGTDGEPLASTTLGVVVRSSEAVRGFEVKTDGDGVLRQLVDDELRAGEELFVVRRDTRG